MKPVLAWWWAFIAGAALFIAAGFVWSKSAPDNLLYNIGAIGACVTALVFAVTYTLVGLFGRRAGWWRNVIGTCLMIAISGRSLRPRSLTAPTTRPR